MTWPKIVSLQATNYFVLLTFALRSMEAHRAIFDASTLYPADKAASIGELPMLVTKKSGVSGNRNNECQLLWEKSSRSD